MADQRIERPRKTRPTNRVGPLQVQLCTRLHFQEKGRYYTCSRGPVQSTLLLNMTFAFWSGTIAIPTDRVSGGGVSSSNLTSYVTTTCAKMDFSSTVVKKRPGLVRRQRPLPWSSEAERKNGVPSVRTMPKWQKLRCR